MILYLSKVNLKFVEELFLKQYVGLKSFSFVTIAFILNFFLVSLRLYLSYRQFGIQISIQAANNALLAGQLGSIIPIFGGAASQSLDLYKSSNISSTTSSFIYFYDKALMAITGLLISLIALFIFFGDLHSLKNIHNHTHNNLSNNVNLSEFIIALGLTLIVVYKKGISTKDRQLFNSFFNLRTIVYILAGSFLSLCSWLVSATCFTFCVKLIGSYNFYDFNYIKLGAMSVIVSFISSMPVSVNGWGIREFSAIALFSLLGISKEVSLLSALTIGVFSTLSLIILSIFLFLPKQIKHV